MSNGKKSGDSKLADAEAARQADQAAGTLSPKERQEALPEILQDTVENAKARGESEARIAFLEKSIQIMQEHILRLSATSGGSGRRERPVTAHDNVDEHLPKRPECPVCRQTTLLCRGEHRIINVMPDYLLAAANFQGIWRNGVHYLGVCQVPKAMADDILAAVGNHVATEMESRISRGRLHGVKRLLAANSAGQIFRPGEAADADSLVASMGRG